MRYAGLAALIWPPLACGGGAGLDPTIDPRTMPRCAGREELPARFEQGALIEAVIGGTYVRPVKRFLADHPALAPYAATLQSLAVVTLAEPTRYPSAWTREEERRPIIEIDAQYLLAHRAAVELALVQLGWFPEATGYRDLVLRGYEQALSGDRVCQRPPSVPAYVGLQQEGQRSQQDEGSFHAVFEPAVTELTQCYLAYIVAHEIAHTALRHTAGRPAIEQEREADAWAMRAYADSGLPLLALTAVLEAEAALETIRAQFGFHPDPSHPTWAERLRMASSVRPAPAKSDCVRLRGRMVQPSENRVVRGRFIDLRLPADLDAPRGSTAEWTGGTAEPVEGTARRAGRHALLQFRVEDDVYTISASSLDVGEYVHWSQHRLGTGRELDHGRFRALVYRSETIEDMTYKHGSACLTSLTRMRRALAGIGVSEAQRAAADEVILQSDVVARRIVHEHTEGFLDNESARRAREGAYSKRNDRLREILGEQGFKALLAAYSGKVELTFTSPE